MTRASSAVALGDGDEDQAVAAKPTAKLDEQWGKGFMKADDFVHMAYQSPKP